MSNLRTGKKWQGFRPVSYSVHKAWDLPLTQASGEGDQKQEAATTIGKVLSDLSKHSIEKIESGLETVVITSVGTVIFKGPSFNREIAEHLLDLQKHGINYFETEWFWYDKDYCMQEPMDAYKFFVVHQNKIVREQVSVCDHSNSGFDPSVFESYEDSEPIWAKHPEWDQARVRQWYQRFYSETQTGRLMVLRPDRPVLFHYERSQDRELSLELMLATVLKSYRLLLVAIPLLTAIAFPSLKVYMAIAAGVFAADFLLVCWRTRKAGSGE